MKNDIETFEFDPDKKDNVTRASLERLLKEIKSLLSKSKKVRVVVSQA